MIKRLLYAVAAAVLLVGIAYALLMTPRPCGMDDISTGCGSGARTSTAIGALFVALLLLYVGRAIGDRRN